MEARFPQVSISIRWRPTVSARIAAGSWWSGDLRQVEEAMVVEVTSAAS
jgi:hypothetical protein